MVPPAKVLVIRFSSVGDIVLASPLLRVLRAKFTASQIDFVTKSEYAELVKFNPNLNFTYEFNPAEGFAGLRRLKSRLRRERYDLIVDIHNSLRSRYLRSLGKGEKVVAVDKRIVERAVLVRLKKNFYGSSVSVPDRYIEPLSAFGIAPDGGGTELHIPDEVLFRVSGMMAPVKLNEFETVVGLCPSSRHGTKRWPAERYGEIGSRAARTIGAKVFIFGGPSDAPVNSAVREVIVREAGEAAVTDWTGKLSLLESAAAMEYCDVVVSNDSGLMHIADAMQKKLVAIFGSTVREFGFFPSGAHSVVLERNGLSCRPCSHIGLKECPEKHFRCMKEIEPGDVFSAAERLLGRPGIA